MIETKITSFHANGNVDLAETFQKLFPNLPLMIATIIAFIIVIFFLTFFFYKPVRRMVKNRQDFIQKNIDDSIENKQKSLNSFNEAQDSLVQAKIKASEIVSKAKFEAEKVVIEYTNRANNEAERIMKNAEQEIKNDKKRFEEDSHQAIIDVAFELANKLVEKEISPDKEKKLIEEYLK